MNRNFKTKVNLSIIALSVLGLGEIGVAQILMSSAPMAMDVKQQVRVNPNFDDFIKRYGEATSLNGSHPSAQKQKNEIAQLFIKYKTIDTNNKQQMFNEIDSLAKKTKNGPKEINGKILGAQAGAIKTYINELMKPVSQAPAQSPVQASNMTLSQEEKNFWMGVPTPGFDDKKQGESALKLLRIWREGTKNLFGGKGFIANDAENHVSIPALISILDNNTGVGSYDGKEWGLCCYTPSVDGQTGTAMLNHALLYVPGLRLQMGMGVEIPKGFLTPEAMDFLKRNGNTPFEMVAGRKEVAPYDKAKGECPTLH